MSQTPEIPPGNVESEIRLIYRSLNTAQLIALQHAGGFGDTSVLCVLHQDPAKQAKWLARAREMTKPVEPIPVTEIPTEATVDNPPRNPTRHRRN